VKIIYGDNDNYIIIAPTLEIPLSRLLGRPHENKCLACSHIYTQGDGSVDGRHFDIYSRESKYNHNTLHN
jgi:hypothetical protein